MNDEIKRNKNMVEMLEHVSNACEGAYGYLKDVTTWLQRSASWKYLYEGVYKCTFCEEHVSVAEDKNYRPTYNYCPYCGAVMKGVV